MYFYNKLNVYQHLYELLFFRKLTWKNISLYNLLILTVGKPTYYISIFKLWLIMSIIKKKHFIHFNYLLLYKRRSHQFVKLILLKKILKV